MSTESIRRRARKVGGHWRRRRAATTQPGPPNRKLSEIPSDAQYFGMELKSAGAAACGVSWIIWAPVSLRWTSRCGEAIALGQLSSFEPQLVVWQRSSTGGWQVFGVCGSNGGGDACRYLGAADIPPTLACAVGSLYSCVLFLLHLHYVQWTSSCIWFRLAERGIGPL